MASKRDSIYFGSRERMQWVRAPDANYDGSPAGWNGGVTQLLNGGAFVRRSSTQHRVYNYSWNMMSRDEIRAIMDYSDGVYGDGPFFFLDPFAMDRNVLPQYWATPALSLRDGPVLTGADRITVGKHPIALGNDNGYPTQAAVYAGTTQVAAYPLPAPALRPRLFIPIPPGYTAHFGVHGDTAASSGSAVQVTPVGGSVATIPVLGVTTTARFSHSWNGDTNSGIEISMSGTGVSVISGMMLQILPSGKAPAAGGFISGQGHAGVRFATTPSLTQYSAALDKVSLSAQLVEDQTWR